MELKKVTTDEVRNIIESDILLDEMVIDAGIYETGTIRADISIGVSYEHDNDNCYNGDNIYVYNIFLGREYSGVSNIGNEKQILPDSVIKEVADKINTYFNDDYVIEDEFLNNTTDVYE